MLLLSSCKKLLNKVSDWCKNVRNIKISCCPPTAVLPNYSRTKVLRLQRLPCHCTFSYSKPPPLTIRQYSMQRERPLWQSKVNLATILLVCFFPNSDFRPKEVCNDISCFAKFWNVQLKTEDPLCQSRILGRGEGGEGGRQG